MIETNKLIICVSPTGNFQGKETNPNMPLQPDEIAEEVYRCWNDGAAIAHIHARDKEGLPTNDPKVFAEIKRRIREKKCDIIIQFSTAPGRQPGVTVDDGPKCMDAGPEMASLSMGPTIITFRGKDSLRDWSRPFLEKWAKVMLERNIKPECEVYNPGHIEEVKLLIEKGVLRKPYWMSIILDMHRVFQTGIRYTPKNLIHSIDMLPPDSMFSVIAIAGAELPATTMSILLGGHVRVGFEDNIYLPNGQIAKHNVQLVESIVRIARDMGREIATVKEAREILRLPG